MNRFTKQTVTLTALALALCQFQPAARAAAADKAADIFPDQIVATGKGFEIKRSQLDDAFLSYSTSVAANGGSIREDERDIVRSNLLESLIVTKILTQKATADEKAKVGKFIDDEIAQARKSAPSQEAFEAQIKANGMSLEQVRNRACEQQLTKRVLERETTNGITISDAAAKKFYDDNPDKFEMPEMVRAAHILISATQPPDPLNPRAQPRPLPADQKKAKEKLAKDIRARAVAGEDFGKLVKQYSEDPGSKDKGGEYKFPKGQMVPEFEAAAFSLKVNQISDLVETQFGYHIIKLLEKFPAKKESLAEASPKIKEYLMEKAAEKALPAYLAKIKVEYNVALVDSNKTKPAAK